MKSFYTKSCRHSLQALSAVSDTSPAPSYISCSLIYLLFPDISHVPWFISCSLIYLLFPDISPVPWYIPYFRYITCSLIYLLIPDSVPDPCCCSCFLNAVGFHSLNLAVMIKPSQPPWVSEIQQQYLQWSHHTNIFNGVITNIFNGVFTNILKGVFINIFTGLYDCIFSNNFNQIIINFSLKIFIFI